MTACFNKGTLVSIMPLLWAVWKCRYAAVDTQPKLQHRKWKNLSIFFYLFFLTNQNLIIIACGYEIKVAEPKLNLNLGAGPSLTTISSPSYLLVCRLITTAVGDTVIWHFFVCVLDAFPDTTQFGTGWNQPSTYWAGITITMPLIKLNNTY